ncbi:MAG: SCO family protein [Bacteroidetes bacterium]|nr:SCO family protein [Bacteroidota bacterium]
MKSKNEFFVLSLSLLLLAACSPDKPKNLPYLGIKDVTANGDTLFHTIPPFAFLDQDSALITEADFEGKVYITDFFFTSCPSICPKMKSQMIRIHDEFLDDDRLVLLSHTIDPENDSVAVLKAYADALDIKTSKWHMVTGDKRAIYDMANKYLVSVAEDNQAPGGFVHGGHFILIDTQKRIRGYYDGTKEDEVNQLMEDVTFLLDGKKGN